MPDAFFVTLNQTVLRSFELHFFSFTRTHSEQVLRCDVRFSMLLFKSSCVLFFSFSLHPPHLLRSDLIVVVTAIIHDHVVVVVVPLPSSPITVRQKR